jgi:hypothetical protein
VEAARVNDFGGLGLPPVARTSVVLARFLADALAQNRELSVEAGMKHHSWGSSMDISRPRRFALLGRQRLTVRATNAGEVVVTDRRGRSVSL